MMRVAFRIYDVDRDYKISEKDLFTPFVTFSSTLYSDVFVLDLPRIMKQLSIKLRINKAKDQPLVLGFKKLPPLNETPSERPLGGISAVESLSLKEFSLVFDPYCPAIIADILLYIAKVKIPQPKPPIELTKKLAQLEDDSAEETKADYILDSDVKFQIVGLLESKALAEKVVNVFRILAENPAKGEGTLYLTLASLSKGFVRLFFFAQFFYM